MNKVWNVIALAGLTGIGLYAYGYYRGLDNLQYKFAGISNINVANNGNAVLLTVGIEVFNPSRFTYPVPSMYFDIYDNAGNYLGRALNQNIQLAPPGYSYIMADLVANIQQSSQLLINYALGKFTSIDLQLVGGIQFGRITIPLNLNITA